MSDGENVPIGTGGDPAEPLERHRKVLPSWVLLYYDQPMELVRGEGTRVWDGEGREYLDFFGGIVTTISGHLMQAMVDALTERIHRGINHTSTLYRSGRASSWPSA